MNARSLCSAIALAAALQPAAARAQWPADSTQFVRLEPGGRNTMALASCPDGLGGIFVCWQAGGGIPIEYLQRVDAHGVPAFPNGPRELGYGAIEGLVADGAGHAAILKSVSAAGDSGVVLALSSYGSQGEERWRTRLWLGPQASMIRWTHFAYAPSSHAWLVAWVDESASPARVRAQAVGVNGLLRWGAEGSVVATSPDGVIVGPAADDGTGGAWLSFASRPWGGTPTTAWLQHVDGAGSPLWNPGGLLLGTDPNLMGVWSLAGAPDGSAWLTLMRPYTAGNNSDRVHRVLADGTLAFGPDGLALPGPAADRRGDAAIAMSAPDRAWLAWMHDDGVGGWQTEAQRLDASGAWVGAGPVVLGQHGFAEYLGLRAYANFGGGVTLVTCPNAALEAPAQRLDADGVPLWPTTTTLMLTPPAMYAYDALMWEFVPPVPDGTGGLIAVRTMRDSVNAEVEYPDFVRLQRVDAWGRHGDLSSLASVDAVVEGTALLAPSPSPMLASARVRFRLAAGASITLDVFDLAGRRVRGLARGAWPAGEHAVMLARDGEGGRLAAGLYWLRLALPGRAFVARLVVLD